MLQRSDSLGTSPDATMSGSKKRAEFDWAGSMVSSYKHPEIRKPSELVEAKSPPRRRQLIRAQSELPPPMSKLEECEQEIQKYKEKVNFRRDNYGFHINLKE